MISKNLEPANPWLSVLGLLLTILGLAAILALRMSWVASLVLAAVWLFALVGLLVVMAIRWEMRKSASPPN